MRQLTELVYKSAYNYFGKKDGVGSLLHLLAAVVTGLVFFVAVGNLFAIVASFFDFPIRHTISKGTIWILMLAYMTLFYLLLFKGLKFSKNGHGEDGLFLIPKATYVAVWRGIIVNFILFFILIIYQIANAPY